MESIIRILLKTTDVKLIKKFFRVEKDDRWWLVTPEGHAFLSFGINHLYPDLFRQEYNRGSWQKQLGVEKLEDWSRFAPALRAWFLQTCHD